MSREAARQVRFEAWGLVEFIGWKTLLGIPQESV